MSYRRWNCEVALTVDRHSASLGAFVIALTFTVDPFLQAVLWYDVAARAVDESARMPVAKVYRPATGPAEFNQPLLFTMYNALLSDPSQTWQVTPDCSTGNCTFNTSYDTLAFCSSCMNITPNLKPQFENHTLELTNEPLLDQIGVQDCNVTALQLTVSSPDYTQTKLGIFLGGNTTAMDISSYLIFANSSDFVDGGPSTINLGPPGDVPPDPSHLVKSKVFSQESFAMVVSGVSGIACGKLLKIVSDSSFLVKKNMRNAYLRISSL